MLPLVLAVLILLAFAGVTAAAARRTALLPALLFGAAAAVAVDVLWTGIRALTEPVFLASTVAEHIVASTLKDLLLGTGVLLGLAALAQNRTAPSR